MHTCAGIEDKPNRDGSIFHSEMSDYLLNAILKQPEALFFQPEDRLIISIQHGYRDLYKVRIHANRYGFAVGRVRFDKEAGSLSRPKNTGEYRKTTTQEYPHKHRLDHIGRASVTVGFESHGSLLWASMRPERVSHYFFVELNASVHVPCHKQNEGV
jgi:hypothetical protein